MHTIMRSIRFSIYFVNRFLPQMVVIRTLLITKPFNKINLLIQIQFYEVRVGALLYVFKHTTLYTTLVHVLLNTLIWYPHKESSAMSTIRGEFNRASARTLCGYREFCRALTLLNSPKVLVSSFFLYK